MLIQATQLLGHSVGAVDEHELLGTVRDIVVDPSSGAILALAVHLPGFFAKTQYLSPPDIMDFDEQVIIVNDPNALTDKEELVRVSRTLEQKISVLHQNAVTKSGRALGTIDDLLIDLTTWVIVKYYVKRLMSERVLPAEFVHSITPKAVVFFDRVGDGGTATAKTEAAAA